MNINKYILIISLGLIAEGCKKFLEIPPPVDQITKDQLFTDSATIASSVNGLYINAFQSFEAGVYPQLIGGLISDEIKLSISSGIWAPFEANTYSETDSRINGLWSTRYKVIYHANSILENLPGSNAISSTLKEKLMGEARFIRALEYLTLTSYFGDVPLVLSTDINKTSMLPRTPTTIIYDTIIADLKNAALNLVGLNDFTRATTWSAQALLARAYLYKGDWVNAENMATKAMTGPFMLEPIENVFLRGSQEAILQVSSRAGGANYTGFTRWAALLAPSSNPRAVPVYIFTTQQMSVFETDDTRRSTWILRKVVNGTEYFCPYKYTLKMPNETKIEEHILLRLPEQMLIKAEALAQLDHLEEARQYVDTVRNRAGLPDLSETLTKNEILLAIEKERRAELFLENDRWFYLKHLGKADEVLSPIKSGWRPEAKLFPVPQKERIHNNNLSQNEGYN